jgi:hypothetical protein
LEIEPVNTRADLLARGVLDASADRGAETEQSKNDTGDQ